MREVAPGVWLLPRVARASRAMRQFVRADLAREATIFNPDRRRVQAPLAGQKRAHPDAVAQLARAREQIEATLQRAFALAERPHLASGVVLRSTAGCATQPAHTDLNAFDSGLRAAPRGFAAGGVVLALQRGTRLWVWPAPGHDLFAPEAAAAVIAPREIVVPPGWALFFRGDVVHAGAAYARANTRVHWYVDTKLSKRTPNRRYDDELRAWTASRGITLLDAAPAIVENA